MSPRETTGTTREGIEIRVVHAEHYYGDHVRARRGRRRGYWLAGRPVVRDGAQIRIPSGTSGRLMVEVAPCAPDELTRWADANRERLLRLTAPAGTQRPLTAPPRQSALF